MNIYQRILELKEETIQNRRTIHQIAEVGLDLPYTKQFIKQQLQKYHIEAIDCGYGIKATIGKGKPVILLRADMDALNMKEENSLAFASTNGHHHACGHDIHSAILLSAAKIFKEMENELHGTIQLMFQSGEETFEGCLNMIENGILENPPIDVAMACHVDVEHQVGTILYNSKETMMNSVDVFEIEIKGKGAHGAYPHLSIDPIQIGVHIHMALQSLIARETTPSKSCILTIGSFHAGTAPNIIPDCAFMQGTIRTNDCENRKLLVERMQEVVQKEAELFRGQAQVRFTSRVPTLTCHFDLTEEMVGYMKESKDINLTFINNYHAQASEDFALISEKVPTVYFALGAKTNDAIQYPLHNPKVIINEDVFEVGIACLVQSTICYLDNHRETY